MPFATAQNVRNVTGILFGAVIVSMLWYSVREAPIPPPPPPPIEQDCIGDPIPVDYAYKGGVNTPHECKVQCEDDEPRYILYSDGRAAQCEVPPGCLDTGEDSGVTCRPPAAMSTINS